MVSYTAKMQQIYISANYLLIYDARAPQMPLVLQNGLSLIWSPVICLSSIFYWNDEILLAFFLMLKV